MLRLCEHTNSSDLNYLNPTVNLFCYLEYLDTELRIDVHPDLGLLHTLQETIEKGWTKDWGFTLYTIDFRRV
jgi:hypothetical protein